MSSAVSVMSAKEVGAKYHILCFARHGSGNDANSLHRCRRGESPRSAKADGTCTFLPLRVFPLHQFWLCDARGTCLDRLFAMQAGQQTMEALVEEPGSPIRCKGIRQSSRSRPGGRGTGKQLPARMYSTTVPANYRSHTPPASPCRGLVIDLVSCKT